MNSVALWYQLAGIKEFTLEIPVNRFIARRPLVTEETPRMPESAVEERKQPAVDLSHILSLSELKQAEAEYDRCPLKRTAHNMVFADGEETSNIMFIGEAPGADEDLQGKPFVGLAGQLLNKMLACIGIDRTNSYITNILPYRPPYNRDPSDTEIAEFLPFVMRHIELVNPKLIVCLGRISASSLFHRKVSILKEHGNFLELPLLNGKKIMTCMTFHPSFLLRTPSAKRLAWSDLLNIKRYMNNL